MKRFQLIFSKLVPYVAVFALVFAIMFFGSRATDHQDGTPLLASLNDSAFTVTSDQVSESYTIANIAASVSLPSAQTISENYVTVNTLYEVTGITSTGETTVIEKPTIIDTSALSRGVLSHVVAEGDNIASIIAKYSLKASKDQIRWSNGLKNETIEVGKTLYLPSVAGIVYTVKDKDTVEGLAEKYKSNTAEIIAYNDLEDKELSTGMRIILPNGVLPEKERPEYVPPKPKPSYTYTYVTDSGTRRGMFQVGSYSYWRNMYYNTSWQRNPGAFGNCTWFAWYWRRNNMSSEYWLPTDAIGNAKAWVYNLSGSYYTGRTPQYGAVFQSTSGTYGHVGVVVGVNPGVSITIQEMNYAGPAGKYNIVYQSTMSWNDALGYNYIYAHK